MNDAEKQALVARLSAGRSRNFRRYGRVGGPGKGTTGRPPFGYYWDWDRLKIDPAKAGWVRRIYALREEGLSLGKIGKYLERNGVSTNRGGRFSRQSVKNILENPYYRGACGYGGVLIQRHHKPLV
ncbi:MAG: recombinase family protein [Proteobacteria bacterium]|nr:recombinase family protein [Pseudomonadota bacterium]